MKRKFFMGVLGMAAAMLPACGTVSGEGAASPEAQTIEAQTVEMQTIEILDVEGGGADSGTADGGSTSIELGSAEGKTEGEAAEAETAKAEAAETIAGAAEAETEAAEAKTEGDIPLPAERTEKELPVGDETPDAYRKIYGQILTEDTGNATVYSLAYVDSDDVPELMVCDMGYGTYSIYTVKDGEAFCMMDSVATVELTYFERNGIVALFVRWLGGGEEGGYGWYYYEVTKDKTLTDGDMPILRYSYEAVYDEDGNWTGEGLSKYYRMEQEVDEAAYQETASGLGIVEENERLFADNTLGKKEMMELLGQWEEEYGR